MDSPCHEQRWWCEETAHPAGFNTSAARLVIHRSGGGMCLWNPAGDSNTILATLWSMPNAAHSTAYTSSAQPPRECPTATIRRGSGSPVALQEASHHSNRLEAFEMAPLCDAEARGDFAIAHLQLKHAGVATLQAITPLSMSCMCTWRCCSGVCMDGARTMQRRV